MNVLSCTMLLLEKICQSYLRSVLNHDVQCQARILNSSYYMCVSYKVELEKYMYTRHKMLYNKPFVDAFIRNSHNVHLPCRATLWSDNYQDYRPGERKFREIIKYIERQGTTTQRTSNVRKQPAYSFEKLRFQTNCFLLSDKVQAWSARVAHKRN